MAPWLCCGNPKKVGDRSTSTSSSSYASDADQPPKFIKYKNHRRTPSSGNAAPAAGIGVGNAAHSAPQRSPVWQRSILMGERCKRPNFSGLILYDEKGNPLPLNKSTRPLAGAGVAAVPPPRK